MFYRALYPDRSVPRKKSADDIFFFPANCICSTTSILSAHATSRLCLVVTIEPHGRVVGSPMDVLKILTFNSLLSLKKMLQAAGYGDRPRTRL